jgi:hypothetical protein
MIENWIEYCVVWLQCYNLDMEQMMKLMMEHLLAEIRTNQAKTEANEKKVEVLRKNKRTIQKEMKTQIGSLISKMDIQARQKPLNKK